MANTIIATRKLIKALNYSGDKITFTQDEFMGKENRPVRYYRLYRSAWDEEKNRYAKTELFSSTSLVRIILYLRDLWDIHQNHELRNDPDWWLPIREMLIEKGNVGYGKYRLGNSKE